MISLYWYFPEGAVIVQHTSLILWSGDCSRIHQLMNTLGSKQKYVLCLLRWDERKWMEKVGSLVYYSLYFHFGCCCCETNKHCPESRLTLFIPTFFLCAARALIHYNRAVQHMLLILSWQIKAPRPGHDKLFFSSFFFFLEHLWPNNASGRFHFKLISAAAGGGRLPKVVKLIHENLVFRTLKGN